MSTLPEDSRGAAFQALADFRARNQAYPIPPKPTAPQIIKDIKLWAINRPKVTRWLFVLPFALPAATLKGDPRNLTVTLCIICFFIFGKVVKDAYRDGSKKIIAAIEAGEDAQVAFDKFVKNMVGMWLIFSSAICTLPILLQGFRFDSP